MGLVSCSRIWGLQGRCLGCRVRKRTQEMQLFKLPLELPDLLDPVLLRLLPSIATVLYDGRRVSEVSTSGSGLSVQAGSSLKPWVLLSGLFHPL